MGFQSSKETNYEQLPAVQQLIPFMPSAQPRCVHCNIQSVSIYQWDMSSPPYVGTRTFYYCYCVWVWVCTCGSLDNFWVVISSMGSLWESGSQTCIAIAITTQPSLLPRWEVLNNIVYPCDKHIATVAHPTEEAECSYGLAFVLQITRLNTAVSDWLGINSWLMVALEGIPW